MRLISFERFGAGLVGCRCRVASLPIRRRASLGQLRRWTTGLAQLCFVRAGNYLVWSAALWLQSAAYGVLSREYVGRVPEILVDEWGRGCVAGCWGRSQLVHVSAKMLYEGGCFDLSGGWYQKLTGNPQGLAIDELCCGGLQVHLVGGAYAGRTSGRASVHFSSTWNMMAAFSVRCRRSTRPLAAGWWGSSCRGGYHTSSLGCGKSGIRTGVLDPWWLSMGNQNGISIQRAWHVTLSMLWCREWGRFPASAWNGLPPWGSIEILRRTVGDRLGRCVCVKNG